MKRMEKCVDRQTCAMVTGYGSSTINFMDPMVGPVTVRSRVGEPYMHPSSKTFIFNPFKFPLFMFCLNRFNESGK